MAWGEESFLIRHGLYIGHSSQTSHSTLIGLTNVHCRVEKSRLYLCVDFLSLLTIDSP